jgi:glycosyltransferase involved in cell wall biosynthesis
VELPSITVISPALDAEGTIAESLASVARQGYPRLQHLVIDGASSDRTVEIARGFPHAEVHSAPDRGLSHAMNRGLALATGDVIGWLNADDIYEPGALERVGAAFAGDPGAVWVTGRCRIVGAGGEEIRRPVTAYKNLLLRRYSFPLYLTHNFVSAPATFMRKSALDRLGPFDERFRVSMDYDMYLRLARLRDPIVLDDYLASFRMAEGSLSMGNFERQFAEHAQNARERGEGHPVAVRANAVISRGIVATYKLLRRVRSIGARRA